VSSKKK